MRIAFILSTVGHPRHMKRIRRLRALGVTADVLGFERPNQVGRPDDLEVRSLGVLDDFGYRARLGVEARALHPVRAAIRRADLVYCFGPDLVALARLAAAGLRRRPPIVLEYGDIAPLTLRAGAAGSAARAAERQTIRRAALLVSTTRAFIDEHFVPVYGVDPERTFVMENKVDARGLPPRVKRGGGTDDRLRIGWFGLLRGRESWDVLKQLVRAAPDRVEIRLRGIPSGDITDRLLEEAAALPQVNYGGRYRVPDDLEAMYGEVDLSWMVHYDPLVHPHTWTLARSNRLYESGWFGVPPVGQVGKDDTRFAEAHDLGPAVDIGRPDEAVARLLAITAADLQRWQQNIAALPDGAWSESGDHRPLLERLHELVA